jgi:hypothetical protein
MSHPQFSAGQNPFADQPPAINPYAAPPMAAVQYAVPQPKGLEGLWRQGDVLIMHKQAPLPPICLKSNQPAMTWLKRNLQWHEPWLAVTILIGMPIYVILALILTKRATIMVPLTEEWMERRRTRMKIAWGIALGGLLLGVLGIVLGNLGPQHEGFFLLLLPAFIIVIVAAIYGQYACRLVYPSRLSDTHIWLKGVHPEFLNRLPIWSH